MKQPNSPARTAEVSSRVFMASLFLCSGADANSRFLAQEVGNKIWEAADSYIAKSWPVTRRRNAA